MEQHKAFYKIGCKKTKSIQDSWWYMYIRDPKTLSKGKIEILTCDI